MTDDNVIVLPVPTRLDVPVERVLGAAMAAEMETAVVIGWAANGDFYFASSAGDGGDVLWLLEVARKKLMEAGGA